MNETLEQNESYSFCYHLLNFNNLIIISMSVVGTILNAICIIVFHILIRNTIQKDNLNRYLLIKSIVDTFIYILIIVIKSVNILKADKSFAYQVFNLIFFRYVSVALDLLSMFLEIASILNRYFAFTRMSKNFNKIGFKAIASFMLVYSFGFYFYRFFDEKIEAVTDYHSNETFFQLQNNKLGNLGIIFAYIHSVVRDGVCVLLIFILNILILLKLRKLVKNKKLLQSNTKLKDNKINKTGFRLTVMVFLTASIIFFGHILTLINYININGLRSNSCFLTFSITTFYACNLFNFILYFYFNLNFKKVFLAFTSNKNIFKCNLF